jgi:recombination endonuclease VII
MNKKERYARCKAEGRCPNCFRKHDGPHLNCERCLEYRRNKYIKPRQCVDCGIELPRGTKRQRCDICLAVRKSDTWSDWFQSLPEDRKDEVRERSKIYAQEWRAKNYHRYRNNELQLRYNISYSEALNIYKEQEGLCAICKDKIAALDDPTATQSQKAHIDHSHSNGTVRAMLCVRCNHLLGNCRENIEILYAAIQYLQKHIEKNHD